MGMSKAMRQMPERSGRVGVAHGEAVRDLISDEASGPPHEHPGTGSARPKAGAGGLLEAALTRENLQAAWKRVKANKGAAGVDGLDIEQTAACCARVGRRSDKRCWRARTGPSRCAR
jgi:RNA-directed DNA polymerase